MPSRRIPLFPLPVVLLPAARMPLHIFEPRYREMVDDCLAGDRPFGLVHHDWDESGPFLGEEGRVGTVARIEEHRSLEEGRSLILVRGEGRFGIAREMEPPESYFEAEVRPYRDRPPDDPERLRQRRRRSLALFETVLEIHGDANGEGPPDWSTEEEISFRLADRIRVPAHWKQSLLELRREEQRLERLDVIFRAALEEEDR